MEAATKIMKMPKMNSNEMTHPNKFIKNVPKDVNLDFM